MSIGSTGDDDDELLKWAECDEGDWDVPEELRKHPEGGIVANFAIIVLSSRYTAASINQAVGRLIVEGSDFNIWFAIEAKKRVSSLALLQLSETSMRLLRPCWDSWKNYERAYGQQPASFPVVEAQRLMDALSAAREGFRSARDI
ncbi:hypothetical protein ABTX85_09000 [Streptomyces sp. NPDC096097]|uniref:hypothetical protein n=1 Tax=Streptomyces sp. NPDC096097 TaxID=3155546 RepID=UPI00332DD083